MPDPRKTPKSKYTADRQIPGAFEGETVTRRRFMTLTVHGAGAVATVRVPAARAGLRRRLGALRAARGPVGGRRQARGLPDDTYIPKVITETSGVGEIGKTTVYMRAHNEEIDGPLPEDIPGTGDFIAISTRCMHLGCPVRYVEASARFICPCHGGVYDFTGKVSGGPPVRPLDRFYVRVQQRQRRGRARATRSTPQFKRFPSYRDPGQDLDGIGQYMYPGRFSTPKLD